MDNQQPLNSSRRVWVIGPVLGIAAALALAGAGYWYFGGQESGAMMGHSSGMHGHMVHDEANMPGLKGENATAEESAELAIMFKNFETLTREVTNLPNGIRTVTNSSDPVVMASLVSHVSGMIGRVETGDDPKIMIQSPTLDIFFARGKGINSDVQVKDEGIVVVQTATDPEIVTALHVHAAEVSDMAARGMAAVHEKMSKHTGH